MNWSCIAAALVCPVDDVDVPVVLVVVLLLLLTLDTMCFLLGLLAHLQGFEQ
jgi:hypothetical protein